MFLNISERGKNPVASYGYGPAGGVTKISLMTLETMMTQASVTVRTLIVNTENYVDIFFAKLSGYLENLC